MKSVITYLNFIAIIFIFFTSTSFAKDNDYNIEKHFEKIVYDETQSYREKVYLHLDKSSYNTGENIWFKVYLINGNVENQAVLSKVVYVELINSNSEKILSKTIRIEDGSGHGDFKLSPELSGGKYLIRAYTNYMRNFDQANFFHQNIFISEQWKSDLPSRKSVGKGSDTQGSKSNAFEMNPDVQFFPEGGNMVVNLINRIGFKAVDENGNGIELSGIIQDNEGEKVAKFTSMKFGMGMFRFVPKTGKNYTAHIDYNGRELIYELPVSLNLGTILQISELDEHYQVTIQSSLESGVHGLSLVAIQNDLIVINSKLDGNISRTIVKVSKADLKKGMIQFILSDEKNSALCERLVFLEKDEAEPMVLFSPVDLEVDRKEWVSLEMLYRDVDTLGQKVNLSMSVTDMALVPHEIDKLDIKSYLLLTSNLKGKIENPAYYFYSEEPQRKRILDILLMTQGWRKFKKVESQNEEKETSIYYPEDGLIISGKMIKVKNDGTNIYPEALMTYNRGNNMAYEMAETDSLGNFSFTGLDFTGATSIMMQASASTEEVKKGKNKKKQKFLLELIDSEEAAFTQEEKSLYYLYEDEAHIISERSEEQTKYDENFALSKEVSSSNENPKSAKIEKADARNRFNEKRVNYKNATYTLDFSGFAPNPSSDVLTECANQLPGFIVKNHKAHLYPSTSITGADPSALLLLNGIPIGYEGSALTAIPIMNIDFVDVLKGTNAAMWGARGSSGVVAVYTMTGSDVVLRDQQMKIGDQLKFTHPGYSQPREFYTPLYEENKNSSSLDYRSTIYWNPIIEIDQGGKESISFEAADVPTTYRVVLEGITMAGVPTKSEVFIKVK